MKTIITLTNFSECSLNAVNYAADMAKAIHADLLVVNILQLPVSFDVPISEYGLETMQQDSEDELFKLKQLLLSRTTNQINITTKAFTGTMLHEIEEACDIKKPFLVVIGTERRNWAERFIFSSNTFMNIKNLHYPVLVVPQRALFKPIRRIALASDFQDIDDVPVQMLKELAGVFNASVEIVHVSGNLEDELRGFASFVHLKQQLAELNPTTRFISGHTIEHAINDYAELHHDDLVMVVARKHNFFDSLVHKSQSRQITLNPHIPVLAVAE